jgi:hypothetical protein
MHEAKDTFGQIGLAAGTYPLEVVAFERTGGEGLELFAAPGSFTSFNANFKLVGDVANGGLAMQTVVNGATFDGFTVRQVEAATATINGLLAADNLLSGLTVVRQDITWCHRSAELPDLRSERRSFCRQRGFSDYHRHL